jgi:hypothetical protein
MRYLLDTVTFLLASSSPEKLSRKATALLGNDDDLRDISFYYHHKQKIAVWRYYNSVAICNCIVPEREEIRREYIERSADSSEFLLEGSKKS